MNHKIMTLELLHNCTDGVDFADFARKQSLMVCRNPLNSVSSVGWFYCGLVGHARPSETVPADMIVRLVTH